MAACPAWNLMIRMDGFAWMFCMLILGIGALVVQCTHTHVALGYGATLFLSRWLHGLDGGRGGFGSIIQLAFSGSRPACSPSLLIGYWHRPQGRATRCAARNAHWRHGHRAACACWRACYWSSATSSGATPRSGAGGIRCPPRCTETAWCCCCWARSRRARSSRSTSGCP